MWRLIAADLRHSRRSLLTTALPLWLTATFVAVALFGAAPLRDAALDVIGSRTGQVDYYLYTRTDTTTAQVDDLEQIPGMVAFHPQMWATGDMRANGVAVAYSVTNLPASQQLRNAQLLEGSWPTQDNEIVVPPSLATELNVTIGQQVSLDVTTSTDVSASGQLAVPHSFTISGIAVPPASVDQWSTCYAQQSALEELIRLMGPGNLLIAGVEVIAETGISAQLQALTWVDAVDTADSLATAQIAVVTGSASSLTAIVTLFNLVALLVAAVVVAGSFDMTLAQRAHVMSVLRTAGATRRQILNWTLTRAVLIGVATGLAGTLAGYMIARALLTILTEWSGESLNLNVSAGSFVTPFVAAILAAVAGASVPAYITARGTPVSSFASPYSRRHLSRLRVVAGMTAIGVGTTMFWGATQTNTELLLGDPPWPLVTLAALGLIISAGGAITIGTAFLAPLAASLGRIVARALHGSPRVTASFTAASIGWNWRRSTANANALFTGVVVVTTLLSSIASADASITASLQREYPAEMVVTDTDGVALPADLAEGLSTIVGVTAVASVASTTVELSCDDTTTSIRLYAADPAELAAVSENPALVRQLSDGIVLVDRESAAGAGQCLVASDSAGVHISVNTSGQLPQATGFTTLATFERLTGHSSTNEIWLAADSTQLTQIASAAMVMVADRDVSSPALSSPGADRAHAHEVVDVLMTIARAFLFLTMTITLLGAANMLSLSVAGRRAETTVLRAVGMTRRQVLCSLAFEATFLSLVTSVLGILLGLVYGWSGTAFMFTGQNTIHLAVSPLALAAMLIGALVVSVLAETLTARRALRPTPVAALQHY